MKKLIKRFIPPILLDLYRNITFKNSNNLYVGGYDIWSDAAANSSGYGDEKIFSKVLEASLAIKNCNDKYERDSVIFDGNDYPWTMLGPLLWIANNSGGRLSVLDYGGSLGNVYFRSLKVLTSLRSVSWNVVEQERYCEAGKEHFQNNSLAFYKTIDDALNNQSIDVALFSSSLQYLSNPYQIMEKLIKSKIKYFIFDRTPFSDNPEDKIVIQRVPKQIYLASYPMWIFSKNKFKDFLLSSNATILTESLGLEGYRRSSDGLDFSFENFVIELSSAI